MNEQDLRTTFPEAISHFKEFLDSQKWSSQILWLSKERITGHKRTFWILRPEELSSPRNSELFYEFCKKTDASIRIDAFARFETYTLAWIENYGGNSRMLNFGVPEGKSAEMKIIPVYNQLSFWLLRLFNKIRGVSPLLELHNIPIY